jgi:hypothetical protein
VITNDNRRTCDCKDVPFQKPRARRETKTPQLEEVRGTDMNGGADGARCSGAMT